MATENSDSESVNGWTLLSTVKDGQERSNNEDLGEEGLVESVKEGSAERDEVTEPNIPKVTVSEAKEEETQASEEEPCSKQTELAIEDDASSQVCKEGQVEVMEDEPQKMDETKTPQELLVPSNHSNCNIPNVTPEIDHNNFINNEGVEIINEDLSDASSLSPIREELPVDVDMKPGVKHYVHTPNTRLNVILNLIVALAVTAVIGLGVGHFLGWSNQWWYQKQVTRSQVLKLKQLEEELIQCMKQESQLASEFQGSTVCYKNSEYWKQRFEELFDESEDLRVLMEKTQDHLRKQNLGMIPLSPVSTNCPSDVSEEFHKLRLDLLVKQMEHLRFLKTYEEVKHQEKESRKRLKVLESENTELKAKLEEEEEDDKVLEQTVSKLSEENVELKAKLVEEEEDDKMLEQRVNKLNKENVELKAKLVEEEEEDKALLQRVDKLSEENVELKAKLIEEEEDDKILVELEEKMEILMKENRLLKSQLSLDDDDDEKDSLTSLKGEARNIQFENLELKKTLEQLQSQLLQSTASSDLDDLTQNIDTDKAESKLKLETLRKQINTLVIENRYLKASIVQLKYTLPFKTEEEQQQQLNELQHENQDLKDEIGRLRYTKPPTREHPPLDVPLSNQDDDTDQKAEDAPVDTIKSLLQMLADAEQESRRWKKLYEEIKTELQKTNALWNGTSLPWLLPHVNWTEAVITGFSNGTKTVTGIITSVLDHISKHSVADTNVINAQLNITEGVLEDFQQRLTEKWTELQKITESKQYQQFNSNSQKLIFKMSQALHNAVQKVQDAAARFYKNQKPLEAQIDKLTAKVFKIMERQEERWAEMKMKWARKFSKHQVSFDKDANGDGLDDYTVVEHLQVLPQNEDDNQKITLENVEYENRKEESKKSERTEL
ncbi:probable E3 ubiquitin-protein ligase bre1 [Limulus polyphemus]|uniref:Probable E3 ubiquitin-protein ligase bre1 n=1 Tax=Limulus polyphemus TaxID=6850 RepID=A0ABM1S0I6_LIMPO|nr:probable E3 ubiquitin-protein ligase bre1 [Limulus polyphemus]XP_013793273.1 probable E3 ubiquitin-protein ligase bre1 [Limulus polyphemus]XP_022237139.1 probable E3 ubiquitin-protein ligase bre1 [Limulus polyphemus]XP_022237140.1 probable E3 ubiquitin-protein ligase bre1 [Limulus polyphemus]XP_022237141.1 probable E3 ubiquitin-protein ligase bre1 [Limulus polyphemus]